jgi:hypothetical protein
MHTEPEGKIVMEASYSPCASEESVEEFWVETTTLSVVVLVGILRCCLIVSALGFIWNSIFRPEGNGLIVFAFSAILSYMLSLWARWDSNQYIIRIMERDIEVIVKYGWENLFRNQKRNYGISEILSVGIELRSDDEDELYVSFIFKTTDTREIDIPFHIEWKEEEHAETAAEMQRFMAVMSVLFSNDVLREPENFQSVWDRILEVA